ncbi:hypothetical protein [Kribbella catacumbae]|uniref:hypothetical protein n=1 Tax=Kribbella catacumbae TaxID=460086 RepID=UPI00037149C1|nr:hypothetical protein [Kribbella catacumbae]
MGRSGSRGLWIVNWLHNSTPQQIAMTHAELAEVVAQGMLRAESEATYPVASSARRSTMRGG